MDELLKAYAAKRKAEADQSSIHPATRKMLQGEVQRMLKKPSDPAQSTHFPWASMWPRLALATAACVLVIAGFVVIEKNRDPKFDVAQKSGNELKTRESSLPEAASSDVEMDALAAKRDIPAPRGVVDTAQPATPPSPAQAPAATSGVLADKVSAAKEAETTATLATLHTEAAKVKAATFIAGRRQYFTSTAESRTDRRAASAVVAPLQSFQIEPSGNRIRIIDSDGSVYEGTLITRSGADGKDMEKSAGQLRGGVAQASAEPPARTLDFNFEVTGTNRTLDQPIRFTGVYLADSSSLPSRSSFGDRFESKKELKEGPPQASATADAGAPAAMPRIKGTLFIHTNQVPISAIAPAP